MSEETLTALEAHRRTLPACTFTPGCDGRLSDTDFAGHIVTHCDRCGAQYVPEPTPAPDATKPAPTRKPKDDSSAPAA